jgi:3-phosphoshikimate 1-carboxyvinyltransferase
MVKISPSMLSGNIFITPSKSHTLRAICFAALASGTSTIEDFLPSTDTTAMIKAVTLFGAKVQIERRKLIIEGFAGIPKLADDVIDCGNSGIVLRFMAALASLIPHYTLLTGDDSIRHHRPMKPLLNALQQLGSIAISTKEDGYAPIIIKGSFKQKFTQIEGQDSQPVSALLIAAAFAPHSIEIQVLNPGEKPWIDLTLSWFDRLGIHYQRNGYTQYKVKGGTSLSAFTYRVPGDFSSAAFPIAAALLTNSELKLENLDLDDAQGDKAIISILEKMGAHFSFDTVKKELTVQKGCKLKGIRIDINDCIDALPILSVIGCFAEGKTEIFNASSARNKESDRISSMKLELDKMGAQIEEKEDGLIIHQRSLRGANLKSHSDHRILFSLSVAALAANGHTIIEGTQCGAKTIPSFFEDFQSIGANIERDFIRF